MSQLEERGKGFSGEKPGSSRKEITPDEAKNQASTHMVELMKVPVSLLKLTREFSELSARKDKAGVATLKKEITQLADKSTRAQFGLETIIASLPVENTDKKNYQDILGTVAVALDQLYDLEEAAGTWLEQN